MKVSTTPSMTLSRVRYGQDAGREDLSRETFQLHFFDLQGVEHLFRILPEIFVFRLGRDVLDGPAHILGDQVEQLGGGRSEPLDAQLPVQEQGADLGAGQQVVDVVVDLGEFVDLVVEFGVHRHQLFIGGLELLLGRSPAPRWCSAIPRWCFAAPRWWT